MKRSIFSALTHIFFVGIRSNFSGIEYITRPTFSIPTYDPCSNKFDTMAMKNNWYVLFLLLGLIAGVNRTLADSPYENIAPDIAPAQNANHGMDAPLPKRPEQFESRQPAAPYNPADESWRAVSGNQVLTDYVLTAKKALKDRDYAKAQKLFTAAIDECRNDGDSRDLASALYGLSLVLFYKGENAKCEKNLRLLFPLEEQLFVRNPSAMTSSHELLAAAFSQDKKFELAETEYRSALKYLDGQKTDAGNRAAEVKFKLADVFRKEQKSEQAEALLAGREGNLPKQPEPIEEFKIYEEQILRHADQNVGMALALSLVDPAKKSKHVGLDYTTYMSTLETRLAKYWIAPPAVHNVTVAFRVFSDGQTSNLRLATSSGSGLADQAALDAVHKAAPLPALPAGYGAYADITYTFTPGSGGGSFRRF